MLADISMEIILIIPFLFLNNTDVKFAKLEKLTQRSYNTIEVLPIINRVGLINKKKLAKVALDEYYMIFYSVYYHFKNNIDLIFLDSSSSYSVIRYSFY